MLVKCVSFEHACLVLFCVGLCSFICVILVLNEGFLMPCSFAYDKSFSFCVCASSFPSGNIFWVLSEEKVATRRISFLWQTSFGTNARERIAEMF